MHRLHGLRLCLPLIFLPSIGSSLPALSRSLSLKHSSLHPQGLSSAGKYFQRADPVRFFQAGLSPCPLIIGKIPCREFFVFLTGGHTPSLDPQHSGNSLFQNFAGLHQPLLHCFLKRLYDALIPGIFSLCSKLFWLKIIFFKMWGGSCRLFPLAVLTCSVSAVSVFHRAWGLGFLRSVPNYQSAGHTLSKGRILLYNPLSAQYQTIFE